MATATWRWNFYPKHGNGLFTAEWPRAVVRFWLAVAVAIVGGLSIWQFRIKSQSGENTRKMLKPKPPKVKKIGLKVHFKLSLMNQNRFGSDHTLSLLSLLSSLSSSPLLFLLVLFIRFKALGCSILVYAGRFPEATQFPQRRIFS